MVFKNLSVLALILFFVSSLFAGNNPPLLQTDNFPHKVHNPGFNPTDEDSSVYLQDFESGWNGWTTVDVTATGIRWHIDDFNAYSGDSWWCGDTLLMGYNNHWLQYLITPTLDFSNVTDPTLTFKLFYAVEDPAGATPPYDGWDGCNLWISIDNGNTWRVIDPVFPAYNCTSLYSFGAEWGMGPGIAGWGGMSGGWVDAEFDLSQYAGQSQVMVRFAFCSDPAYCTMDDPDLICMFVDNVVIADGGDTLLYNNADDPPVPEEFSFGEGEASGDWWIIDDQTFHSPSHCATCVIENHYNLSNALETDWITIPDGYPSVYFTFWLWCDMLDWDGDGNNYLEDYYMVEVSQDGINWEYSTYGFYDYGDDGRPGAASVGWEEYLPGDPFNGNIQLDLTPLAGEDIKMRWRVVTDDNDDGGIGSGLHIDDFNLWVGAGLPNDVSASAIHIPFPTSLSNQTVTGTVTLENPGTNNQPSIPAFARQDSSTLFPLIPWANIPAGGSVEKEFNWSLTDIGDYYWDAYTALPWDENTANDTCSAGVVTVTPEGIFELGYDARGYTWPGGFIYYWSFDPGNGAMVRFVPAEHEIPGGPADISTAKMQFYSAGSCVLHIYDDGTATEPGDEIASIDVNVTTQQLWPDAWKEVDLSGIPELSNRTEPFWFWVESLNSSQAQITGHDAHFGEGHYFTYNGSSATPTTSYEFYIRCIADLGIAPDMTVELTPYNPPIVIPAGGGSFEFNIAISNNTGSTQNFDVWTYATLPSGAQYGPIINVQNINLPGGITVDRDRIQNVPAGAPAGAYTYDAYIGDYPNDVWSEDHFDFSKSADFDGGIAVNDWKCFGEPFAGESIEPVSVIPGEFSFAAPSPNPFNPTTTLSFTVPQAGMVKLTIFDVTGREVAVLQNGYLNSGNYTRIFDASEFTSGVYFACLEAGSFKQTHKIILLK